jgi:hypothetical protein
MANGGGSLKLLLVIDPCVLLEKDRCETNNPRKVLSEERVLRKS